MKPMGMELLGKQVVRNKNREFIMFGRIHYEYSETHYAVIDMYDYDNVQVVNKMFVNPLTENPEKDKYISWFFQIKKKLKHTMPKYPQGAVIKTTKKVILTLRTLFLEFTFAEIEIIDDKVHLWSFELVVSEEGGLYPYKWFVEAPVSEVKCCKTCDVVERYRVEERVYNGGDIAEYEYVTKYKCGLCDKDREELQTCLNWK